jgi:uncharacterized protein
MTPQESSMLEDLVRKVVETKLTEKDFEAEKLLQQGLGRDPDAIYKLSQTVLVQNLALNHAREQIRQLQQAQPAPPVRATSFLGGLLGHRDPSPPPPQSPYQPVPQPAPVPPPYATATPYAVPPSSPAGSFLRSAATTAAGVAAGALAFEGLESLLHGGHGGGWGGAFGSGAAPVEETVINNYYDDLPQPGEQSERQTSYDDDRPEERTGLEDTSYQPDTDATAFDDSQTDDSDSDFGGGDDSNFS